MNAVGVYPIPCDTVLPYICINHEIDIRMDECKSERAEEDQLKCLIKLQCNETELIDRNMTKYEEMVLYKESNISRHANHCETILSEYVKKKELRSEQKENSRIENVTEYHKVE